ncbi:MAG: hypothetical protein M1814_006405 [Vezdaea aestivalis]|nr:MAG: hypothetical protein M1814_006405 [Vezdaea aestivalis]
MVQSWTTSSAVCASCHRCATALVKSRSRSSRKEPDIPSQVLETAIPDPSLGNFLSKVKLVKVRNQTKLNLVVKQGKAKSTAKLDPDAHAKVTSGRKEIGADFPPDKTLTTRKARRYHKEEVESVYQGEKAARKARAHKRLAATRQRISVPTNWKPKLRKDELHQALTSEGSGRTVFDLSAETIQKKTAKPSKELSTLEPVNLPRVAKAGQSQLSAARLQKAGLLGSDMPAPGFISYPFWRTHGSLIIESSNASKQPTSTRKKPLALLVGSAKVKSPKKLSASPKLAKSNDSRAGRVRRTEAKDPSLQQAENPDAKQESLAEHHELVGKQKGLKQIIAQDIEFDALPVHRDPIPSLAYGLDRVLFNPGVYHLQDPRSRVYNFDPYLEKITPSEKFNFDLLPPYHKPSEDGSLEKVAVEHGGKYYGSTSTLSSTLAQFHFLLSHGRALNTSMLAKESGLDVDTFTSIIKAPASTFLMWKDGAYAIDGDKEYDETNILMQLGKSLEKALVLDTKDFKRYLKDSENPLSTEEASKPEAYHYSKSGDLIVRSQLDAHDPRIPGTGVFDLKTRAVLTIRHNADDYKAGSDYELKSVRGTYESFEREYWDMMRATLLKYMLQVRMGRMDGIFVAYHNVERIFGFQYVSLSDMDLAIHGTADTSLGDHEFKLSLKIYNDFLDQATAKYPKQNLRITFEDRSKSKGHYMYAFAEPMSAEEVEAIQSKSKDAQVDGAGHENLADKSAMSEHDLEKSVVEDATSEESSLDESIPEQSSIEELASARDASEEAVEGGPIQGSTLKEKLQDTSPPPLETEETEFNDTKELFARKIYLRSFMDSQPVARPHDSTAGRDWKVEYAMSRFESQNMAWHRYRQCRERRKSTLQDESADRKDRNDVFRRILASLNQRGQLFREELDKKDQEVGVRVYGQPVSSEVETAD